MIGTHYLQDINHDFALSDACVYSQRVMGEAHVLNVVDMAVRSAIGARGPAAIAFPIDIQSGEAVSGDRSIKNVAGHSAVAALDGRRIPPRERIEEAARLLSGAEKPLIFIGAGARGAGDEVERAAEGLGAQIVKAMLGDQAGCGSLHLGRAVADRAILCGDSGTVTTWAARTGLRRGQMFSFSGTMCSMTAALPYAIGAQAAYPDRQVVALTGDGSLTMMVGELATLAQHALPVKVVVMRSDVLGLIKWEQMAFLGNPQYGVELAPVEFAQVTQAWGIRGTRIDDPARMGDQLGEALAADGPELIEVLFDPHDMPMTPTINREHATASPGDSPAASRMRSRSR